MAQGRVAHDPCGLCPPPFVSRPLGTVNINERGILMGLDMYAMTTDEKLDRAVDFIPEQANEIFYWRKHPNLHGWMEKLYYEKGGSSDCFNCAPVVLTSEDLDRLEAAVKGGNLPHTTGFFFGVSEGREAEDLAFIAKAREALGEGESVFFHSWW